MPRLIIPILAILIAGSALVPGRLGPAAAYQASPAASPAADCPATTEEEMEELSRRYVEAYNARNPEALADLLAEDFVRYNAAAPQQDQQPGYTDDIARLQATLAAFPDLQLTMEDLFIKDDTIVAYTTWKGTQDGPLPQWDAPATGRPMVRESISIWRVECGRLAEARIVQDNLTMLSQLGIITDGELTTVGTPTVATPAP
jgi:steroid delta-isomerase-like uncharacterized protein